MEFDTAILKKVITPRDLDANKGDFGYVGIMGGSRNYPGAIKLANLGQQALYSGCGVSRVIVPECIANSLYPHVLESTIFSIPSKDGFMAFDISSLESATRRLKSLSVGMGWGATAENRMILEWLIKTREFPIVIDADGLNVLSQFGVSILKDAKAPIILTPHPLEFSRLMGVDLVTNQGKLRLFAKKFAEENRVVLVLKGHTTYITDGIREATVTGGCPGMATAGSGDVLSGVLAGMLGYSKADVFDTVCSAVFINAKAGELAKEEFGDYGMVSSDTARCVSKIIKKIERGSR